MAYLPITQQILNQRRKGKGKSKKKYFILLFLIIGVYYLKEPLEKYIYRENRYDSVIKQVAKRHCIDSRFIKSVIWKESKFDALAVGGAGEIGLMQITTGAVTDWANYYKVKTPCKGLLFHPELNIEIGTWYLAKAFKHWHDYKRTEEIALCQYNAGRKQILNWEGWRPAKDTTDIISIIRIDSTKQYVIDIMNRYFEDCNE